MTEHTTRRRTAIFDRVKVLLFLVTVGAFFVWKDVNDPFTSLRESFSNFAGTTLGRIILVATAVEVLRQIHYLISEHWAWYNHFWSDRIFEGTNRQVSKRVGDFTRFRIRRVVRWAILILIYAYLAMFLRSDVSSPGEAITRAPDILLSALPVILQFAFFGALVMFQFVAIFWFRSRGGIDIVFPEDIETRFDRVWGQDHVLSHIKENIAFLEKPDEIEAKGGYIPGGILLWGPPGTGKTLIAEAIAGEVGKPFVFVDPGAFIQMFFGVGILKVKRLFRKLRKLSIKHGGVVVFFDEADSLGSRGGMLGGGPPQQEGTALADYLGACNGFSYLSPATQRALVDEFADPVERNAAERRPLVDRIVMGAGMGGGGMGTLQALLTEISGLTKPRGLGNRIRRILGMKPKLPPKYRILIMMATNMPGALDPALLRPGRIDRMYKVGYPSKEGRVKTLDGYLQKLKHDLTPEQVEKVAVTTPYFSGAQIKDLVNEALIHAIREERDTVRFSDVWHAKALKQFGPPDDHEYVVRERWAVAIHEASHAVTAHLLRTHAAIDIVTIERRGDTGGFVSNIPIEDRFTAWRSEKEADIKTSLASLAGERIFFGQDNSSGVSGDLMAATRTAAAMEGVWGMGDQLSSYLGISVSTVGAGPDPTDRVLRSLGQQVERKLQHLYDEVVALLEEHREQVLQLAGVLVERRTISGDDVAEILGIPQGSRTIHRPVGFIAFDPEPEGFDVARHQAIPAMPKPHDDGKKKRKKKASKPAAAEAGDVVEDAVD